MKQGLAPSCTISWAETTFITVFKQPLHGSSIRALMHVQMHLVEGWEQLVAFWNRATFKKKIIK